MDIIIIMKYSRESYDKILKEFLKGINFYNFIIWNRVVLILWLKKILLNRY